MFYIALVLAGGFGVLLRYLVGQGAINLGWTGLPFGTLIANLIGCFCIGYLSWVMLHKWQLPSEMQTVVLTGFLGGFTTFSAFSFETVRMLEQGKPYTVLVYVMIKVVLCISVCFAGLWLARQS